MIQFNSSIGSSQNRSTVKVWYVGENLAGNISLSEFLGWPNLSWNSIPCYLSMLT